MEIWNKKEVTPELLYRAKIGGAAIWIKHSREDWYVATESVPEDPEVEALEPVEQSHSPESGNWKRWISGSESKVVQLLPVMPDRPVVLRPEYTPQFPPRYEALLFVSIPIFIRVAVGDRDPFPLCEIPTVTLSKTWFGDTLSGLPCYSLITRVERRLEELGSSLNGAVCPLRIRNRSKMEFDFQRFCLHVENLSVFSSPSRLWTNSVEVVYRGEEKTNQIEISEDVPDFGEACERICSPRAPMDKGLVSRSFQALKILTGTEEF